MAIHVTVWNEYLHEKQFPEIASIYPKGIHGCIADFLQKAGMTVQTATLEEPEHGLTQDVLDNTDVLIWWGHMAHHKVADEIVERVYRRVLDGMGLIVLHSGHASKIFQKVCGTNSGRLKWREDGEQEILWVIDPSHPIVAGLDEKIMIPHEEMYGEHFDIPHPGHEAFPIYYQPEIQQVIVNAVKWATPIDFPPVTYGNPPAIMEVHGKLEHSIQGLHQPK